MKIYVAAAWRDRKRIRATWIDPLREDGHEITHDWTEMEDERLDEIGNPLRDINYHRECAHADINGVIDADLVLVIMDSPVKYYSYRGTFTEIGCRIGANKILKKMGGQESPIILYNPWIDSDDINDMMKHSRTVSNVFFWSSDITRVMTGNAVFREIDKHAKILHLKGPDYAEDEILSRFTGEMKTRIEKDTMKTALMFTGKRKPGMSMVEF
jgi:hypothetical protein